MKTRNVPAYSDEVLADLKLKHKHGLFVLSIYPDGDEQELVKYIVKKPTKQLAFMLSGKEYENDNQASGDALIANCVLAGDMELLEDDAAVFTEVITEIGVLMKTARGELKKV